MTNRSLSNQTQVIQAIKCTGLAVIMLGLAGCASISVPLTLSDNRQAGDAQIDQASATIVTGSVEETTDQSPNQTDLPPMVRAVTQVDGREDAAPVARPADALVASLSTPAQTSVSLTQGDLSHMGAVLTARLADDPDLGTFEWSHEATGRSGLMTPFRTTGNSDQTTCRMVSVEITDGGRDIIRLADACLQDDAWVFVTPRAGEPL